MAGAASDLPYLIVRPLLSKDIERLGIPTSWWHNWDDGWSASVSARVMESGERKAKSAGFRGYDWMVDRIVRWGDTRCRHEWKPEPDNTHQGKSWERCVNCRSSRETDESKVARALMKEEGA